VRLIVSLRLVLLGSYFESFVRRYRHHGLGARARADPEAGGALRREREGTRAGRDQTIDFVKVPAGRFVYGKPGDEKTTSLDTFYISRFSVTNAQFCVLLNQVGNRTEHGTSWIDLDGESPCDKCRIVRSDGGYGVVQGIGNVWH